MALDFAFRYVSGGAQLSQGEVMPVTTHKPRDSIRIVDCSCGASLTVFFLKGAIRLVHGGAEVARDFQSIEYRIPGPVWNEPVAEWLGQLHEYEARRMG